MKIIEFQYTKPNGDISNRCVAVMQEPCKFIEGLDLSGLDQDEFAEFTVAYSNLYEKWRQDQLELINQFDLRHNYRRFSPENMKDVTSEYV